jgi:methyltransferase (TIGR00027 family)
LLADELPEDERLISDPFARLFVDDAAVAAARADAPLQNVIRLRTRYIDDAVATFVAASTTAHAAADGHVQIVLLGAGLDARAFRMDLDATFFEVDFPDTLQAKSDVIDAAAVEPRSPRITVPIDLAASPFADALLGAGFDPTRPTIVVWEGVINYLDDATATAVVTQLADLVAPGGVLVADYVEMSWFRDSAERSSAKIARQLRSGGEPLRTGLADVRGTLDRAGFDVVDDEAVEELAPRYGRPSRDRVYPARIFTARKGR